MSSAVLGTSEQQNHVQRGVLADVLSVFSALADQDRLTNCLVAAGCLATARLVCRRLRDLVDGGVKSIKLSVTADKADTIAREQTLAALLRRWDRCQGLTVELKGNWGDHAALIQAMPQWLFAGVPNEALFRITTFTLSTRSLGPVQPNIIPLVSALAASMPSLRHLDLSGCPEEGWKHHEGIGIGEVEEGEHPLGPFFTVLASSCPQLETLALPWDAPLPGMEALAGSLVRLKIGAAYSSGVQPAAALQSISRLGHLRELLCQGLELRDGLLVLTDDAAGPKLLLLLDSLPPSVELLQLKETLFIDEEVNVRFCFRGGHLCSVDLGRDVIHHRPLMALAHALLRCRAADVGLQQQQQQRPSLRIREVIIKCDVPVTTVELGPLRERFNIAALDAISFKSLSVGDPVAVARSVGSIQSGFGLPRELRDLGQFGFKPLPLGRADASSGVTGSPVGVTPGSTAASAGSSTNAVASSPAAAPSPRGGGSSQTGGSAALIALETAGAGDVLQVVAERLWAAADVSAAAGSQAPGPASIAADGWDVGKAVVLHGPCREWGAVTAAIDAQLQRRLSCDLDDYASTWRWRRVGSRFVVAICSSSWTAVHMAEVASSPDGPCVRHGIQVARLRAGAVRSALEQVLLELWHGSATSGFIMSPGQRLERLVELMVRARKWCQFDTVWDR